VSHGNVITLNCQICTRAVKIVTRTHEPIIESDHLHVFVITIYLTGKNCMCKHEDRIMKSDTVLFFTASLDQYEEIERATRERADIVAKYDKVSFVVIPVMLSHLSVISKYVLSN